MKKALVVAICVLSLLASGSVFAQAQPKADARQSGIIPEPQSDKVEVKTIFAYKKEIGITDRQEQTIKDILTRFQDYLNEKRKELTALSSELSEMIKDKTNLRQIRKKIDKIAEVQADASYSDVETARNIEKVLTKSQMTKWQKIQEDFQKELQSRANTAAAKK